MTTRPLHAASAGLGDLDSAEEINRFVKKFYGMVAQDDLLAPMFEDAAGVDWGTHIDKLTLFWARALLSQAGYSGNPFNKHKAVNEKSPMRAEHFERWLDLFHEAISEWHGPLVERAKGVVIFVGEVHSKGITGQQYSYPRD